ncbi:MAG TPA: adenylyl-sulfate kinase [Bacteroidales bacterium]|nr:adenylyl-sulfate kinase [Bacteroidales bacterium]
MPNKREKEILLNQKGVSFWLTGLPGSGKTTIAKILEEELFNNNILAKLIDGDIIRSEINTDLGYSISDRTENIRRAATISKMFNDCGIVVINCFISPTQNIRSLAKEIIGSENFYEIFINCPLDICEQRDPKGMYKKARRGDIKNFTGISSIYEKPENADLVIDTGNTTIEDSVKILFDFIMLKTTLKA